MGKVYNKLVRDNIPDIIRSKGENPIIKILDDIEYKKELENKLLEEYKEVIETTTSEERIEELADIYEIIKALANLENKNIEDIAKVANEKCEKRGGFNNKIYLEKVTD